MEQVRHEALADLPLHTITEELWMQDGLKQRFDLEISKFDLESQEQLEKALLLAEEIHYDQKRSREPYMNHILRVAIRVKSHYGVEDADVITAALLHDTVEDHAPELAPPNSKDQRTDALQFIADLFNPRVAGIVDGLSNPPVPEGMDKDEAYRIHVAQAIRKDPWVKVIKISDFTDNGAGIEYTNGEYKKAKLAHRYKPLIPIYRESIANYDTPLSDEVIGHILRQLDLAEQRINKVLAIEKKINKRLGRQLA